MEKSRDIISKVLKEINSIFFRFRRKTLRNIPSVVRIEIQKKIRLEKKIRPL